MLFRILKLFGVDIPGRMAEVRIELEERFDLVKDSVEQAAQTVAVMGMLLFVAGLAALSAFIIGLIALYSWVSSNYGEFYGLAAIGGILLFIAIIAFATAVIKAKSWRDESASRVAAKKQELAQTRMERVAEAREAIEEPEIRPLPAPRSSAATAGGDLIEPLMGALSKTITLPATGNSSLDELLAHLRSPARGIAEEMAEGLASAVRHGDRPQLLAVLGSALLAGWFLGRHSERKIELLRGP